MKCLNRGKWEQRVYPLGTPFGYLKLSRAIRGTPCLRARAPPPPARSGDGARGLVRAWAWARVQPGPVLFEPGYTGLVLQRVSTRPAPLPSRYAATVRRNRCSSSCLKQLQRFKQEPSQLSLNGSALLEGALFIALLTVD